MIRIEQNLNTGQVRSLLQRFRDLNLGPCGVEISSSERIKIAGCISLDHPVERGVRYCLQREDGPEQVLRIEWKSGKLLLTLRRGRGMEDSIERELLVELGTDGDGRIAAPELGARIDPSEPDVRDVEHFMRRIVRAVCTD